MKTIPLQPVFDNDKFVELTPTAKYYLLECIYTLAKQHKLKLPLPKYLRQYVCCSNPHLFRFKDIYRGILEEVIPEIIKIKQPIEYRREQRLLARYRKRAKSNQEANKDVEFSDGQGLHVEIIPVNSPRKIWNEGKFDHVERAAAVTANDESKEKDTWLKDT